MDTNNQNRLIPLELTRDDLGWLRAFLDQERSPAEVDRQKVKGLHTSLAGRAAMNMLNRERETMTKIIDEICRTLDAIDAHEAVARMVAATLPAQPPVA